VFSLPAELSIEKAGSIGRPNFFVDARVVDPVTGEPVATGATGELVLRGPSAMTGYFRDPAATAAAFDGDGWLHTGDLARVDEDGCFFIVDRLKDMYISGGENVYPAEVEAALHGHPAVAQCAVVGVRDATWGQVGRAFVVLRAGMAASAEEILAHAAGLLARYKVPRSVVFREALPVSGAGKVLRRELRDD
jgi:fatty-acyl-CoA synthase